jgi:L-threonylcarbamoyladenylate synthase
MIKQATPQSVQEAVQFLQNGKLVVFPTETVYGLGGDATQESAINKIYTLKNRPSYNPLIIHVSDLAMAESLAHFDSRAHSLATSLWPGPLTLILPAKNANGIATNATAGLPSIALRIPAHPIASALLTQTNRPIAAPSANISGSLSPTRPDHVARHLLQDAPEGEVLLLASGATLIGLESTVLDLTTIQAKILRHGAIDIPMLEPLIGSVLYADGTEAIKAPGQLKRDYATKTHLRLNAIDVKHGEGFLGFGRTQFIGVEGIGFVNKMNPVHWCNLSAEGDLHQAATHLYAMLDTLDQVGISGEIHTIAVQRIPAEGLGLAINDRLARAAVPL